MINNSFFFDIETESLSLKNNKILFFSYKKGEDKIKTTTNHKEMKNLLLSSNILIGHNIINFDIPIIEDILKISLDKKIKIDTLILSWYLNPLRRKHSLESFSSKKIKIDFNKTFTKDLHTLRQRCEKDIEINYNIYIDFMNKLNYLYGENIDKIIKYLQFKGECLLEMKQNPIKIDKKSLKKFLINLEFLYKKKELKLKENIPKRIAGIEKKRPKNFFKKNGEISLLGKKYFSFLEEKGLDKDTDIIYKEVNPGSHKQLKDYLFFLGWKPNIFKESTITKEKVPQILNENRKVSKSVKELEKKDPNLKELDTFFIIKHRIGVLKSLLESSKDTETITLKAHGFTNTLRLKHSKPIANLPKPKLFFGKEIRSILISKSGYDIIGIDIKALEDTTKQHYIFFIDKKYVMEMRSKDFDPHLDIAILSGLISKEESNLFKEYKKKEKLTKEEKEIFSSLDKKRFIAKSGNFAMTYGAFPKKVSEVLKISKKESDKLFKIFWERNKAIKIISQRVKKKKYKNETWIYNPVSGFWLYLKNEKDIFSTLNQSTGVYVFDTFLKYIREKYKVSFQYHDELFFYIKEEESINLKEIINKLNKELSLNVPIEVDMLRGKNYSSIH